MDPKDKVASVLECIWEMGDISFTKWVVAVSLIISSIILRRFLARGVVFLVKRLSTKETPLRDQLLLSLLKPISFIIVIFGFYLAGVALSFPPDLKAFYNKVLNSLITFTFFWGIYCLLDPLAGSAKKSKIFNSKLSEEMYFVIFRLLKILIGILGLMTLLELWNINVFAFVASLGLLGMAVALAAQSTLKNLFGTLTIITDHAVKKGDWIKTPDVEGIVENIGFRATVVRQTDKSLITVPNAKLAEAALINFSKMPYRLVRFKLSLSYDATVAQLQKITERIRAYLFEHPELETASNKVPTVVRIDDLGHSSIDILCHFFTKTIEWTEYAKIKEQCLLDIMRIVESEGATLSLPTLNSELFVQTTKQKTEYKK
jgi:MscS family membrane protein